MEGGTRVRARRRPERGVLPRKTAVEFDVASTLRRGVRPTGGFCVADRLWAPRGGADPAFCGAFAKDQRKPGYKDAAELCAWTVHCEPGASGAVKALETRLARWSKNEFGYWPRIRLAKGAPPDGSAQGHDEGASTVTFQL